MKIKIKYHNKNCKLVIKGNWIDLKSAETVEFGSWIDLKSAETAETVEFGRKGDHKLIPLGVSMQLPKYFQANVVPRSGTYKKYGVIMHNHYGVIDGPDKESDGYSGNDDVWMFGAISMRKSIINEGDRIAQFEIKPSMFAPWWVKLKWLFTNKIEFIEVDDLESKNRGGFGSTGK